MKKILVFLLLIFAINPTFVYSQNFAITNFFAEKLQKEFLQKLAIEKKENSTVTEQKFEETQKIILENSLWETIKNDYPTERIFQNVNALREQSQLQKFAKNNLLQKIALRKAEHMAENQYVGHWSPDGKNIFSFMTDSEKNMFSSIGENVASGYNVTLDDLYAELLASPSHYGAMVSQKWQQYGSAMVEKNGNQYFVQIFSQ